MVKVTQKEFDGMREHIETLNHEMGDIVKNNAADHATMKTDIKWIKKYQTWQMGIIATTMVGVAIIIMKTVITTGGV